MESDICLKRHRTTSEAMLLFSSFVDCSLVPAPLLMRDKSIDEMIVLTLMENRREIKKERERETEEIVSDRRAVSVPCPNSNVNECILLHCRIIPESWASRFMAS